MADAKISALTASTTPLAGTEVLPIVQTGTTKQVSVANLTAGRAVSAASVAATGRVSGNYVSASGNIESTGPNLGHAASRIIMSWEGGSGAYFQSYGPNASTLGEFSFRQQSSDASVSATALQLQGGNIIAPVGSITMGTAAKGVAFTANTPAAGKTSQLLNWYEEGTWTPVVSGTSTAGTYEFAINGSKYTRVGRTVTLQGFIRFAAAVTGGGVGALSITGLPFSKSANSYPVGGVYLALGTYTGNHPTVVFGSFAGSSQLLLQQDASGGYGTNVDISYASANAYLTFTITYEV